MNTIGAISGLCDQSNADGQTTLSVTGLTKNVRAWRLCSFHSLISQYPNLSEGADSVGGQLRGDEECPFSDVTTSGFRQSLEEGAEK